VRAVGEQLGDWLRSVRFTVHALEGRTRGGQPLCILYAGGAPYRHYLRGLAFADGGHEHALGRHWRWQLGDLASRRGADLRATRCARALRRALRAESSFYVPEWLWSEMPLGPETARQTGNTWTKIRKFRLVSTVTRDPAALEHFYERMYVPLVKASHGDGALFMGRDYMLRRVANGEAELVSVLQDGVAVGGCIVVYDDGCPRLFSLGVLDADASLLRQRVGVAIYLYSFCYLFERGFTRVNLGRSRPFLHDGVLRFKLDRGAKVTGSSHNGITIEPLRPSAALTELLCSQPCVGEDDDGLAVMFFTAPEARGPTPAPPAGIARVVDVPLSAALARHPRAALASCR